MASIADNKGGRKRGKQKNRGGNNSNNSNNNNNNNRNNNGNQSNNRPPTCRAFQKGNCTYGDSCKYEHVKTNQSNQGNNQSQQNKRAPTCRAFQKGKCTYGDSCKYEHTKQQAGNGEGGNRDTQQRTNNTSTTNNRNKNNRDKNNNRNSNNRNSSNNNNNNNTTNNNNNRNNNRNNKSIYKTYEKLESVQLLLAAGDLLTGTIRISSKKRDQAFVTVRGLPSDIYIHSDINRNRALNGDKVVLRLLEEEQWKEMASIANLSQNLNQDQDDRTDEEKATAAYNDSEVQKLWNPVVPKDLDFLNPSTTETSTTTANNNNNNNNESKTSSLSNDLTSKAKRRVLDGIANGTQAQAEVVYILERGCSREVIGTLEPFCHASKLRKGQPLPENESFVKFKPMDSRYPFMLLPRHKVPKEYVADPLGCDLRTQLYVGLPNVFQSNDEWSTTSRFPKISLSRPLGEAGEISAETEALLVQHGFGRRGTDGDFSSDVLECLEGFRRPTTTSKAGQAGQGSKTDELGGNGSNDNNDSNDAKMLPTEIDGDDPRTGWTIPPEEIQKRRDLRKYRIFSIDPTTAKDLDDALHVTKLDDGRIELGVHIADVSYYVKPGNPLDEEAKIRATTVYLVQKSLPMLPRLLSENLCSLNPNQDRLAYSCIWWMTPDGNMTSDEPWYGRSVIRSCCKLDYGLAQKMIEQEVTNGNVDTTLWPLNRRPTGGHLDVDVCKDVMLMNQIAKQRRLRRYESGSLALQGVKLCFKCDRTTGNPIDTFTYPIKDSNRLVEEYMLLANYLVAQKLILGAGRLASIRRHPKPHPKKLQDYAEQCKERGFNINVKTAGSLHKSLLKFENAASIDPITHYALTTLATTPMKPAVYFAAGTESRENWRHYALNIPYYTHFTSPIRRYADVMVHRLLTSVLENDVSNFYSTEEEIHDILENCNEKKEASKAAQERGDTVYFCVFLKAQKRTSEAVVMDWGDSSFELFIPEYGVSKRVHVDDLNCQLEKKQDGFHLRPNNGLSSESKNNGTSGGCDWKCKCGWNNKSNNKVCGGGSSSHGCGGLAALGTPVLGSRQQQQSKSFSGCKMKHSSLPSHGFFVKMLTRMKVELFHLDQIPIDFALEIQDIYNWEPEKK